MSSGTDTPGGRPIGVFPVRVEEKHIRDFAVAVGAAAGSTGPVPFAFPVCWLSIPEIRTALMCAVQEDAGSADELLPVHLEQHIALSERLQIGKYYTLSLAIEGPDARRMVKITGQIAKPDARAVGSLSLRLALVTLEDAKAPPCNPAP